MSLFRLAEPRHHIRVRSVSQWPRKFHPPEAVDSVAVDESDHGEATVLHPGSYVVVQCEGGSFLRCLQTDPASFGEAGGHLSLAMEDGVIYCRRSPG